MTPLERFKLLMGAFLVEEWQPRAELTDEVLLGYFEHGIPLDWAQELEKLTKGRIPVSFWPKVVHPPKALHKRLRSSTVNDSMHTTEHRVAISKGAGGDTAFRKAINGRDYTQNRLAKAVGISPATLSFYRNGRKTPRKVAEDIERLTGWKAAAKNWPGGIHGEE